MVVQGVSSTETLAFNTAVYYLGIDYVKFDVPIRDTLKMVSYHFGLRRSFHDNITGDIAECC